MVYYLNNFFFFIPEIHKDSIWETIINAFCHRDYSVPQKIQVAVFKDFVEVLNPGDLYGDLTIKEITSKRVSKRRNPLIADILHKVHYVEKWGTGIKRIKEYAPKTKFEEVSDFFIVTLKRKYIEETTQENGKLNKELVSLLNAIDKLPGINAHDLFEELERPWDTINKQIKKFVLKNLIERRGSRKTGGYWIK